MVNVPELLSTPFERYDFHRIVLHELKKRNFRYRFKYGVRVKGIFVDFYCHELRVVMFFVSEGVREYERYECILSSCGYRVMKFTPEHVICGSEYIFEKILFVCLHLSSH